MIAQNSGHQRLLGRLESAYDTAVGTQEAEIPSGDELAEGTGAIFARPRRVEVTITATREDTT